MPTPDIVIELLNQMYDADKPTRSRPSRNAQAQPQDLSDLPAALLDEAGEELAVVPDERDEPAHIDLPDVIDIDSTRHTDQMDPIDIIVTATEDGIRAEDALTSETTDVPDHTSPGINADAPMLGHMLMPAPTIMTVMTHQPWEATNSR